MEDTDVAEPDAMFRDWAGLPGDLLTSIGDLLGLPARLCFRCVCRSWSAALPSMPSPWLVIPDGAETRHRERFTLLSLPPRNIFRWTLPGQRCIGSSQGWLAFVDIYLSITLLNPLSNAGTAVRLPPIPLQRDNIHRPRVGLSSDDTLLPCTCTYDQRFTFGWPKRCNHPRYEYQDPEPQQRLLCRYHHGLAFTRAGSKGWQYLDWPVAPGRSYPEQDDDRSGELFYVNCDLDLVYHGNKFYYMTLCGQIWSIDAIALSQVEPVRVAKWRPPGPDYRHYVKHIVFTSDGALHVVWSDMPGVTEAMRDRPMRMRVQRYDPAARRWRSAQHLGGSAFLIGHRSQSVAGVPASSPSSAWLRPNCVYFTNITPGTEQNKYRDQLPEELDQIWEFDVEAGRFRSCDRGGLEFDWVDWPKAIWFTPRMVSNGRRGTTHEIEPLSWV
ncbi:hypothetical protein QOZ80_3AG0217320 [Eleusine coracana subsp. coracana]|nr:hypothetical protein QOZ80_3AG0217320 [Eleusine coracana subsp. coracana]